MKNKKRIPYRTKEFKLLNSWIEDSFLLSIEDYKNSHWCIEEDFRANLFFHLRNLRHKRSYDFNIFLSRECMKMKPDVMFVKEDDKGQIKRYLAVVEIKNMNKRKTRHGKAKYVPYNHTLLRYDRDKLKRLGRFFDFGYLIHITNLHNDYENEHPRRFRGNSATWKKGFFRELCYHPDVDKVARYFMNYRGRNIKQVLVQQNPKRVWKKYGDFSDANNPFYGYHRLVCPRGTAVKNRKGKGKL